MVDTTNLDRPRYDALAGRYARFRTGYSDLAVRALEKWIPSSGSVLDVATGTGILAKQLEPITEKIVGLDVSLNMLRAGRGSRIQAAAEHLPFKVASFDAVTCSQAFHWLEAIPAAAEFQRVVRPGGIIAILFNYPHPDEPFELIADQLLEEMTGIPQKAWRPPIPHELGELQELVFSGLTHWKVADYVGWMSSRESIRQRLGSRLQEFLGALEDHLASTYPEKIFQERQIEHLYLALSGSP